MNRRLHLLICLIIFIANLQAQDVLVDNKGKKIDCKITGEDSLNVYFDYYFRDKIVSTFGLKSDFQTIQYSSQVNSFMYSDVIVFQEEDFGYSYSIDGRKIEEKDLAKILIKNEQASNKLNESYAVSDIASILSFAGGALIGYPIGTYLAKKEPLWILAGVGAGLVFVSIPIFYKSGSLAKEAVEIYNQDFRKSTMIQKELKFGLQNNGIGLSLNF